METDEGKDPHTIEINVSPPSQRYFVKSRIDYLCRNEVSEIRSPRVIKKSNSAPKTHHPGHSNFRCSSLVLNRVW
eukprot:scaffold7349_cov173-Amphora_coffeaeformis.AAC.107